MVFFVVVVFVVAMVMFMSENKIICVGELITDVRGLINYVRENFSASCDLKIPVVIVFKNFSANCDLEISVVIVF